MRIYPSIFTAIDRTPFTYFIRHKITKFMYYGSKTSVGCRPEDLWTTYFTSSTIIKEIIKNEGKDIFDVKISRIFNDKKYCLEHEIKFLVRLDAANNTSWYNQHNGAKNFSTSGKSSWNSGMKLQPLSEAHKKKLSMAGSNRIITDIHKNKIAKALKGITRSDETKLKLSRSLAGRIPWNKGKKGIYSDDTLNKMSINAKNRKDNHIQKLNFSKKGIPLRKEHRNKISESCKLAHTKKTDT